MENDSVSLADLRSRAPVAWQWPGDEHVVRCLQNEAPRLLAAEGMALDGLEAVLWRRAWIRLQVFRDLEWPGPDSSVPLLGAEVEGAVQVSGETVLHQPEEPAMAPVAAGGAEGSPAAAEAPPAEEQLMYCTACHFHNEYYPDNYSHGTYSCRPSERASSGTTESEEERHDRKPLQWMHFH